VEKETVGVAACQIARPEPPAAEDLAEAAELRACADLDVRGGLQGSASFDANAQA